ncbi:hypothetical protein V5O48_009466 [Marasmius crinis-equi]|uniref:F-box domain-containing protein n=1 Tax=Marasmius crinis-equi TaxID=585013 RepID=A0ABR3FB06_9AGAR
MFMRFIELVKTFAALMEDFAVLSKTVRAEEYEDEDWDKKVKTFVRYEMQDEEPWRNFRLRWKTPRLFSYAGSVPESTSQVLKDADGKPKLQKLCLMDLPPELIDYIFSFASLEHARILASTCRTMKSIGVPHLYHTRKVKLSFPDWEVIKQKFPQMPPEEEDEVEGLFIQHSEELSRQVEFLVSRPDLTGALQNLSIGDDWRMGTVLNTDLHPLQRASASYLPVNNALRTLLTSCSSLTYLSICHWAITSDWLRTLSQLPKLHSIHLHSSRIEAETVENDILHGHLPRSPQVLNLSWYEPGPEEDEELTRESAGYGLWYILVLFPSLITFSHLKHHPCGSLPCLLIRERATQSCSSLRRVQLCLASSLVLALTEWFRRAQLRTHAPCTLTHFKLRTNYPLLDDVVIHLLESIQSAPLEVLVIECIKEGSLTLVERIAQLFPDLLGLMLIRRDHELQWEIKAMPWPHQSSEYAFRLQGFRKLKYFGWNFRMQFHDHTPSVLLQFETSALTPESEGLWPYDKSDEFFDDASSIALPFGCYCPTLETVGVEDGLCRHHEISRMPDGQVKATGVGGRFGGKREVDSRAWNPYDFDNGSKRVLPDG